MSAAPVHIPRPKRVVTKVATAYSGKSRFSLMRARGAGLLSTAKVGRTVTWSLDEIDRWMAGELGSVPAPAVAHRAPPADDSDALARIKRTAVAGKAG